MGENGETQKISKELSRESNMSIVVIPPHKIQKERRVFYGKIIHQLEAKPGAAVEITCESIDELQRVQTGFHVSGTWRRLKEKGWKIHTRSKGNDKLTLEVRLEEPSATSVA